MEYGRKRAGEGASERKGRRYGANKPKTPRQSAYVLVLVWMAGHRERGLAAVIHVFQIKENSDEAVGALRRSAAGAI